MRAVPGSMPLASCRGGSLCLGGGPCQQGAVVLQGGVGAAVVGVQGCVVPRAARWRPMQQAPATLRSIT